mmetsp:Transcript_26552/g.72965  ORF Transcript_26552/g.72965 Transcript_26552/m.72965 type:complete len:409 (+) Transcript_26552:319-1545(+)
MCIVHSRKGSMEKPIQPLGQKRIDSILLPQPTRNQNERDGAYREDYNFDPSKYEPRPLWGTSTTDFIGSAINASDPVPEFVPSEPEPAATVKKFIKVDKLGKNHTVAIVQHNYHDYAEETEANYRHRSQKSRGGVAVPFPLKLHDMLEKAMNEGYGDIVSWQPHGRSFVVHKPQEFQDIVLPKYYKLTKLSSFQRQLNLYGFQRLTLGRDRGSYYHELFLRKKTFLARNMQRVQVKGTGVRARSNPDQEPNFWTMKWCESQANAVSSDDDSDASGVRFTTTRRMSMNNPMLQEQRSSPATSGMNSYSLPMDIQSQIQPIQRMEQPNMMVPSMGFNPTVPRDTALTEKKSFYGGGMSRDFEDEELVSSFGNHKFHYLDPFQPLSLDQIKNQKNSEVGRNDYAEIANLLS